MSASAIISAGTAIVAITNEHLYLQAPYILEPIALFTAVVLTHYNHIHTRRSSTILLLFWPVYVVVFCIWARTFFSQFELHGNVLFALRCSSISMGLASFVLECFSPEYGEEETTEESPLLTANVFSIWFFSWVTPFMKDGAKQHITESDLPPLLPEDDSEKLGRDLERALSK